MNPIGADIVVNAIMVVIMLLIILSVPSIFLTVRGSARLLRKYKLLRSIEDISEHDVSPQIISEWNAVKSQMAYTTIITTELEKLGGLKPAFFQAEVAIVLSIIMMIWPGFEKEILILMIVLVVISVIAVIYGMMNTRMYAREYIKMLSELDETKEIVDNGTADGMYG